MYACTLNACLCREIEQKSCLWLWAGRCWQWRIAYICCQSTLTQSRMHASRPYGYERACMHIHGQTNRPWATKTTIYTHVHVRGCIQNGESVASTSCVGQRYMHTTSVSQGSCARDACVGIPGRCTEEGCCDHHWSRDRVCACKCVCVYVYVYVCICICDVYVWSARILSVWIWICVCISFLCINALILIMRNHTY